MLQTKKSATSKAFMFGAGQAVFTPREYDKLAEEGYERNVIAYRCVSLVSRSAAYVPLKVFDGKEELEKHPLLNLLQHPNETQGCAEFLECVYAHMMLSGNSYIEAAFPSASTNVNKGEPTYLYTKRPDRIQIKLGQGGQIAAYIFTADGSVEFPVAMGGLSNILHVKNFHPTNDYYGLSPIEAAAYSIDQHNQSGVWNQALLQNGARPSGALIVKGMNGEPSDLSDDQFTRLKEQMDEQYSGASNAGRPMLLEGGMEWQEMSLSPRDMDFINSKNTAARDIALAFGVPSQLLGIPGDNTYANMAEARLALWDETILPMTDKIVGALNRWLAPRYGDNVRIGYDKDAIEALTPRRESLVARLQESDFMTDNEKRNIFGLEPIDGGDELRKPNTIAIQSSEKMFDLSRTEYKQSLMDNGATETIAESLAQIEYGSV